MSHLDILMERLRHYDEIQILELLDLSSDDILNRFQDVVLARREYLMRELEVLEDPEEEIDEFMDGFQVEFFENPEE
jgi:hypothetical protein